MQINTCVICKNFINNDQTCYSTKCWLIIAGKNGVVYWITLAGFIGCFLFPLVVVRQLYHCKQAGGWKRLRTDFPTLTLIYRRSCWYYSGWNIMRAFVIIGVASMPSQKPYF